MGLVLMSARELNRLELIVQIKSGQLTVSEAARLLGLSRRTVQRIVRRYEVDGPDAVRHKLRGRTSNRAHSTAKREYVLGVIREKYHDFGPQLVSEKLAERDGIKISAETCRKWMIEDGLWVTKDKRRRIKQLRLRRECYGELVQIDGSIHHWFEDRGPRCTLLVFIDDATGRLMDLQFVRIENTFAYMSAVERYLINHGRPVAFYSDKHSVFRPLRSEGAKGGAEITQFGRALEELNIEIICAPSPESKGRVERANRTLQDRLVKELRLENISDMQAGNAFLPGFMKRFNERFGRVPARDDNAHRTLNKEPDALRLILCKRDVRRVTRDLAFRYHRHRVILDRTELSETLVSKYVDVYVFEDRSLEVQFRGQKLGFRLFDKDQRVTQAQIVENKFLGETLSYIKKKQEDLVAPARRSVGQQRKQYKRKDMNELARKDWGRWGETNAQLGDYQESEHLE